MTTQDQQRDQIFRSLSPYLCEDVGISSSTESIAIAEKIPLVQLDPKINEKPLPPVAHRGKKVAGIIRKAGPVSTSTKQITGYTTIKGIQTEIGCLEYEYPQFGEKELMENAYDSLQDNYSVEDGYDKESRKIAVRVKIDPIPSVIVSLPKPISLFSPATVITHVIRIAVRNSNVDNVVVFENLEAIFDYDSWYSSKRNQFRITSGALGDYLKRALGMGYALWTSDFNPENSFEDKQWHEPIIFRFNGQERKVYLTVEPGQKVQPLFDKPTKYDTSAGFTEVEIAMPIATYWNQRHDDLLHTLKNYCRKARLSKIKTDVSFTIIEEAD